MFHVEQASETQRHDHVAAALVRRLTDQRRRIRITQLHDHDLVLFSELATLDDDGASGTFHWRDDVALPLRPVRRDDVPARFAFVASPALAAQRDRQN